MDLFDNLESRPDTLTKWERLTKKEVWKLPEFPRRGGGMKRGTQRGALTNTPCPGWRDDDKGCEHKSYLLESFGNRCSPCQVARTLDRKARGDTSHSVARASTKKGTQTGAVTDKPCPGWKGDGKGCKRFLLSSCPTTRWCYTCRQERSENRVPGERKSSRNGGKRKSYANMLDRL